MSGGTLGRHKRTKIGMLPGDISIQAKARMLEKGVRVLPPSMDPKGTIGRKCAKGMKKGIVRKANRRARHTPIETTE
jgi:hypothetical protein